MVEPCFVSGVTLLVFASLCSLAALAFDNWEAGDIDTDKLGPIRFHYVNMRAGLWHEYRTFHRSSIFEDVPNNSSDVLEGEMYTVDREINYNTKSGVMLLITRVFLFLATFSLFGAIVCIILKINVFKTKECLMTVSWILSAEAGALLLVSFIVYMKGVKEKSTDFHAAFYIDIIGWILAWLAAVLLFMSSRTFGTLVND